MNLLRKFLLCTLATIALLGPSAAVTQVQATPGHGHSPGQTRIFWVYYRTCPHSSWVCYGGYYHANQAIQAVNWFRYNGYDAFYR